MLFNTAILLLGSLAGLATAFQEVPGPPCTTPGTACSYTYVSSTQGTTVTVEGMCAPDGYCADNGATCSSDANCYDSCGSGVCGGTGATCNSADDFAHGQFDTTCNTDAGNTCDTTNQVCLAPTVVPSQRRKRASGPVTQGYQYKQYKPSKSEESPEATSTAAAAIITPGPAIARFRTAPAPAPAPVAPVDVDQVEDVAEVDEPVVDEAVVEELPVVENDTVVEDAVPVEEDTVVEDAPVLVINTEASAPLDILAGALDIAAEVLA